MPNPQHASDLVRGARDVFTAWLRERQAGGGKDFASLLAAHPDSAQELQALYSICQLGQAAAASGAFQQTLRKQFGDDAEVTVRLEEGFGVPPSVGAANEPAKAGTPNARYALEDEVARGGMGVIFRVRDRDLSRTLAMKVMTEARSPSSLSHRMGEGQGEGAKDSSSRLGLARFLEEAQVTAQLDHPNIVPVHEVGFDAQGQPFFTMKLVKGRDLNEIFKLARAGEGWRADIPVDIPVRSTTDRESAQRTCPDNGGANVAADRNVRAPMGVPPSGGPDRVNAGLQTADGAHGVTRPTQQSSQTEPENWNLPRAVGAIVKACQALAYAHSKGVIHRDLKPANIMVGRFGEVFVMDWGLAKITGRKDLHDIRPKDTQLTSASLHSKRRDDADSTPDSPLITMDGSVVGTPAYMPPEQAKGQVEQVDAQSDIYSLGAILYNLLTGQAPYVEPGVRISPHTILARVLDGPPKRIHTLNSKAPAELVAICEKAMAREKPARYASSLDLAEDLQAYLDNRVVKAYRTGAVAEFKSWVARNKGLSLTAAAAALLVVAGVSAVIWQQKQGNERLRRNLYVADMNVAQQALAENNVGHALALVRKYFPKPGEADLPGFEWRYLWQLCQGDEIFSSSASDSIVTCVAFSPDGKFLATAGFDKRVTILDLTTRKSVAMFGPFDDVLWRNALIFSLNGKILAITDGDKVSLCETATWQRVDRMLDCEALGHGNASARPVAFSPDGNTLAVKTVAGIQLWDTATWQPKGQITGGTKGFGAMFALSPDGALLAVGTNDRIILWDLTRSLKCLISNATSGSLHVGPFRRRVTCSPPAITMAMSCCVIWPGDAFSINGERTKTLLSQSRCRRTERLWPRAAATS